jgi:hypothetical protein
MDLKRDDLSPGLAKAFVPDHEIERDIRVVTSKPVDLYFSGSDFHLVKARDVTGTGRNPAQRIKGSTINRISACTVQE